jgi:hypothetical protein
MARKAAIRPAAVGVVLIVGLLMLTVVRPVLAGSSSGGYAGELAKARTATMKYANGIAQAKKDGYMIITKDIAGMGWHFLNPNITKFDVTKPMILVYEHKGNKWTLGALEWVFPSVPNTPPLRDATYGSFPAACHYKDGSFVPAASQSDCPTHAPGSTAPFTFWHPPLFTMHLWLWYANPAGLYSGTNPLVAPFNS